MQCLIALETGHINFFQIFSNTVSQDPFPVQHFLWRLT